MKERNLNLLYINPKNNHNNTIPFQSQRMQNRRIESLNVITAYRNVHGAVINVSLIKLTMPIIVCRLIVETRS